MKDENNAMTAIKEQTSPIPTKDIQEEIRRLRDAARRVTASPDLARKFLASTGMYTSSGKIKPQFR